MAAAGAPVPAPVHHGIVGGGLLGLTLAWRLAQAGQRVTVVEAAPALGGLAGAWQIGPVTWDRYYHVIDGRDAALRGLLGEMGLQDEIAWADLRSNFYDGRTLRPLNHVLDYLRLPGLGLADKLRLAATLARAAAVPEPQALETLSAQRWLTDRGGDRNWRVLWRPLLRAKLGANAEHASAAYIVAVIRRFVGGRQGALKIERYGHVRGGYARVLAAMEQRLAAAGVTFLRGCAVQSVQPLPEGGFVIEGGGQALHCDRAVLTCAAPLAARLCPALQRDERARLQALRWQGVVCLSLLLKRPLGGAYLTYITDETLPFTTVIEMTTLVDPAALGGHHLVYLPRYVPVDDALFDVDDATVVAAFTTGLRRMFPDLRDDDVVAARVARARHVLAIATQGYSALVPPMATSLPGLSLVNSAQILNAALSVEETVRLADAAAARLLQAAPLAVPEPA